MERRKLTLGIDLGTNGCKASVLSDSGSVIGNAFREYQTYFPKTGWAEQNPQEWYDVAITTAREALSQAQAQKGEVRSIGLSGHLHSATYLSKSGEVLRPGIVWMDQRSERQVEWLRANIGEDVISGITYNLPSTTLTLPNVLWVKENQPETWKKVAHIIHPKDYIIFRLTGRIITDHSTALGTMMMDGRDLVWSQQICDKANVPLDILPEVASPDEVVGGLDAQGSADIGLAEGTPVVAGSGDAPGESLATGLLRDGDCLIRIGTCVVILVVTRRPVADQRILNLGHVLRHAWLTTAATQTAGEALRWFRDTFYSSQAVALGASGSSIYQAIDSDAESVPIGAEGLIFHPYLMGERCPYWDSQLKGHFIGITTRHKRAHFSRAVLEGIALSMRDCLEALHDLKIPVTSVKFIGGGAKSPVWRKIVCDVLGDNMSIPAAADPSIGVAMLAGVGVGMFADAEDAVTRCLKIAYVEKPDLEAHESYEKLYCIYRKAHDQTVEIDHDLHAFVERGVER
jgi:xylulokinase